MAYCSEDDLLKMVPQSELADLTAESGEVPDSLVVAEAISKADADKAVHLCKKIHSFMKRELNAAEILHQP